MCLITFCYYSDIEVNHKCIRVELGFSYDVNQSCWILLTVCKNMIYHRRNIYCLIWFIFRDSLQFPRVVKLDQITSKRGLSLHNEHYTTRNMARLISFLKNK